jgi:hypothetical protein
LGCWLNLAEIKKRSNKSAKENLSVLGSRLGLYLIGYVLILISMAIYGIYIYGLFNLINENTISFNLILENLINMGPVWFFSGWYLIVISQLND